MVKFRRGSFLKLSFGAVLAFGSSFTAASEGWTVKFDASGSNPVVAEGVLYIGSANGAVYALDIDTGNTKWRFQTGEDLPSGPEVIVIPPAGNIGDQIAAGAAAAQRRSRTGIRRIDMSPAVADGSVYLGSGDHFFYALDAATGCLKWSYQAGAGMASKNNTPYPVPAPVVGGGVVYFATEDGLHAVDASTGERRWLFETLTEVPAEKLVDMKRAPSAPVLVAETFFLTAWPFLGRGAPHKSYVYAIAADTGTARWVASLDGTDITAPVVTKGLVLVSTGATVHAIDAHSGETRWRLGEGKNLGTPRLMVVDNAIYFATDSRLLAADLESGRQTWHFNADRIEGDLVADDQHVYVITWKDSGFSTNSTLRALAQSTGQETWSQRLGGFVERVTMHGGILYLSGGNSLHAVDAATGRKKWSFKAKTTVSPAVKSGERIFLASSTVEYIGSSGVDQGYLFSIDAETGK
jgi:outer membrane protein assembly factor BamB